MADETNEPQQNDRVTLDWPGELTPEDDWEEVWPKSHKVWNLLVPFEAVGHTEEQAIARYEQFRDTLGHIQLESDGLHPLIEFVSPGYSESIHPTLAWEEVNDSFPIGGMASGGLGFYWDYWHPDATANYDYREVAGHIRASQWYDESESERLSELAMIFRRAIKTGEPLPDAQHLLRIATGAADDAADGDGAGQGSAGG